MNGRERILAAFKGEKTDVIPFAPNVYLWFYYHQFKGTLPPELANAKHPLDVVRYLGGEILARWDTQLATNEKYTAGEFSEEYFGENLGKPVTTAFNRYPPGTDQRRRQFVTPYGTLSHLWRFTPDTGADFEADFWWKTWEDYPAIRFMLESTEYEFDADLFRKWKADAGNDGVVMVHITESPLKRMHWLAGPANATLFMLDHPEETRALAKIHEDKAIALLERIVDHVDAEVFVSLDNLDSAFYPPYFYRDYCDSFFSRAADIIHKRNKHFVVHACGRNRALMRQVGASHVDMLEGITPPPMGDIPLKDVRVASQYEHFVANGGMDAPHLEIAQDAEAQIHAYTRDLFESMGDKSHFIFATSCSTSPVTPWKNLVAFRDAAREYGEIK